MPTDEERLWQQVGDDEVIYDGWLKIHRRTYRLPDGRIVEWDMHAGGPTVAVLALTPSKQLVMVRQFRPGPDRVVLTLPGGMIDPGESPEQAGERELREETGYAADSVELVASAIANASPYHRHVVIARDCTPGHALQLDDYEDCEPLVMDVAQVREELRAGRMTGSEQVYLGLDHAGLL
ncbi:MAG TPA: NUDIX hydrolase [Nocardioidaceae bacterium]|nr:NUDIX hydrolase [Nocardioidaceae bacterium]